MTIDELSVKVADMNSRLIDLENKPVNVIEGWMAHAWATIKPVLTAAKSVLPYALCVVLGVGLMAAKDGCNPVHTCPTGYHWDTAQNRCVADAPTDPFNDAVKSAYVADGSPAAQAAILSGIFRDSQSIVHNGDMKTTGDILKTMHVAASAAMPDAALAKTRRAIADELNKTLGKESVALDTATRTKVDVQFQRVTAALLEAMK